MTYRHKDMQTLYEDKKYTEMLKKKYILYNCTVPKKKFILLCECCLI